MSVWAVFLGSGELGWLGFAGISWVFRVVPGLCLWGGCFVFSGRLVLSRCHRVPRPGWVYEEGVAAMNVTLSRLELLELPARLSLTDCGN